MKKLLQIVSLIAAVATILWLTRERLLPAPRVTDEPPPPYRSTPPPPSESVSDDLTTIKGVGAVYSGRLNEAGISSFVALSEADADTVADSIGTSPDTVEDWIAQARAKLH